jgi:glycosyltransferase involved in cell wall biosynthesis
VGHTHHLCFVGPMIGRNAGYVTTQGEILSDRFASAGYPTISVSASPNRYVRLYDIVATILRRRRQVDIQCLQVYGGPSFIGEDAASWLARRFGQHIVMVLRGGAMPEFMARHPRWACRVLRRADAIVTPSAFLERAVARFGFDAHIVPNVLDLAMYPYRHRRHVSARLFWMRSFHSVYNPEMALRVLALVRQEVGDATLVMAGQDKGRQSSAQAFARTLGLDGAVRWPGYLDMAAKVREGGTADIFLNTNRVDNTPVAVLEACALGLPVVATNVGGIPDLLTHDETGLLVPDDDEHAMASAVVRLLRDPGLAGRLSASGRSLAESFSWEQVRPQWEALFATVVARRARRSEVRR